VIRGKNGSILAIFFLVLVPIALFWPALFFHKMLHGHDIDVGFLPFHAEIQRSLAAHQWPLWVPDLLGGMPGIGSCLLMFLYPTDLIASLAGWSMQSQLALDASVHVALAGIGMFLFLRRLDRSVSAALLGAFFFALSGSQISQIYGGFYDFVEGIALLPWVFWAVHKACGEDSPAIWSLCGVAFALQILAGATQLFTYTLAASACFALSMVWIGPLGARQGESAGVPGARLNRVLLGMALALALAFLIAAPQIWLTLQYLPLTARQGYSYSSFIGGSIKFSDAINWLVPGFFGWQEPTYHGGVRDSFTCEYLGLLPLALATASLSLPWRRRPWVPFMLGLALSALFFAQGEWTPFYSLIQALPVLKGFRIWSRALFLATFSICTLAAFGWDALKTRMGRTRAGQGLFVFAVPALCVAAWARLHAGDRAAMDAPGMPWLTISLGVQGAISTLRQMALDSADKTLLLVPILSALLWLGPRFLGAPSMLLLVLVFHVSDQVPADLRFIHLTEPTDAAQAIRFAGPAPPKAAGEPWRIFDPDRSLPNNAMLMGYDNLYGEHAMPMAAFVKMQTALLARPDHGRTLLDLFNVRYPFVHSKGADGDLVTIHENQSAYPRAWLVTRILKASTNDDAYRLLADARFDPRTEAALAEDLALSPGPVRDDIRWSDRTPQTGAMAVTADRDSVLMVSNMWYPSWRCKVDGVPQAVMEADGGLQAVALKAGTHQVEFYFDTGLLKAALMASLTGLAIVAGLVLFCRRKKNPEAQSRI